MNKFRQLYDRETEGDSDTKAAASPKLLTIELTDEQSIPRVIYKGEELTGRVAVEFLWHTDNANGKVPTYINIEKHNGNCNIERITYNPDSAEVKRYNLYGDSVDA
ncbi:hypothetical protein [Bacillus sp. FSL P4-0290]|uniref:hypothetical protein n=1 Tax=Bacillus sp. FSL P4-0290 TaxID=2921574 RepID=UPI0030CBDC9C